MQQLRIEHGIKDAMKRIPVESSDITSIGYDDAERILEIEFKGSRVYRYLEVPKDIYDKFMKADSYGQYFNSYIHSYYRYRKVENTGTDDKPDTLAFVTGNARKFRDLKLALGAYDIEVEQLTFDVDEIQSTDAQKIALQKAKQAFKTADRPVVIQDAFWGILALRGFPGAYMKEVASWLKPDDFLALMADKKDRSITCTDTLVYYDGKRSKAFSQVLHGMIIDEPRGKGFSIDQIVVIEGQTKTIAELENEEGVSSVAPHETIWGDFAKWYNMQRRLKLV